MGMSKSAAVDQVRSMGLLCGYSQGELRINLKGGSEDTAYYTDDPQDAVDTAKAMKASTVVTCELTDLIKNLVRRGDCRADFWIRVAGYINCGTYRYAMEAVLGNRDDTDFCEQIRIVSSAIIHREQVGEV